MQPRDGVLVAAGLSGCLPHNFVAPSGPADKAPPVETPRTVNPPVTGQITGGNAKERPTPCGRLDRDMERTIDGRSDYRPRRKREAPVLKSSRPIAFVRNSASRWLRSGCRSSTIRGFNLANSLAGDAINLATYRVRRWPSLVNRSSITSRPAGSDRSTSASVRGAAAGPPSARPRPRDRSGNLRALFALAANRLAAHGCRPTIRSDRVSSASRRDCSNFLDRRLAAGGDGDFALCARWPPSRPGARDADGPAWSASARDAWRIHHVA